ncbi:MAG TPA: glycosyltransferase [Terriglobales bacterium]|nr:glycosyltransferase [Terriglobales bacterium]
MSQPVFYDPDRKRWKRLRVALDVVGVAITFVVIVFLVSVVQSDTLPTLLQNETRRPYRAVKEEPKRKATTRKSRKAVGKPVKTAGISGEGLRAAYYVTWDAGAFSSLREYHQQIDLLFPEWLHMTSVTGKISGVAAGNKMFDIITPRGIQPVDDKVMPFLKKEGSGTDVVPLVNNYDPVSKQWLADVGTFLMDPIARRNFRRQTLAFLLSDDFKGIAIDFEEIPYSAQPGLQKLLDELYADLHPRGLKVFVNVPVDNKDFDLKALSRSADALMLMNYDEHHANGKPGPVASQEYFTRYLREALTVVPREKLICAIGNYGYEWTTDKDKVLAARSFTVQEAWLTARESDENVTLDADSLTPHVAFLEENNLRHDVWFLDGVTAFNQMRAANQLGLNAFALWRLGAEDRSLWGIWDNPSEAGAEHHLADVPPGQDVDIEGRGEVLHIEQYPQAGKRTVTLDAATGFINQQSFTTIPTPYQIMQYGAKEKQIALTFDDGPDPRFTPKILDILKAEQAPATFFVIGIQAEKYASITRRIYREGHEIGNHTFTHPDISQIGRKHMEIELNLTERLLSSELGVKPIYFRPPYSIDQEPDTADQVRPLEIVQNRGYITVGNKIDPNDWRTNPSRTAEMILEDVLAQLDRGNIVLLHDGGGDRKETVRALPMIIRALRERGYEIVSVAKLLDKTPQSVMPPITGMERVTAQIDRVAFTIFGLLNASIVIIFFVGDFLMTGRLTLVGLGAVLERFWGRRPIGTPVYTPSVAVLIPAYNEEKVIERTVRAAVQSDYPNIRVVVVDDGSSDHTYEIVKTIFGADIAAERLLLLTKDNAGKAAAANFGLQHIQEEIFVAIDADTEIASNAISRMVPYFADLKIGAIAGNAKVGNRVNLWTRWQALEYITSQNFERRALDLIGAVSVVPGAIGAWRTSAVRKVGNYPYDTVAEDADLTMSLLQAGYRVHYEDRALAYTEAPLTASGLMRQRFRWSFGILQAVWKHQGAFLKGGTLGWVALPNILIFQILLPLVSPFIDVMFLIGVLSYGVDRYFHPEAADPQNLIRLLVFFAVFLVIDFAASTIAFLLERKEARVPEDKWLLSQVWLQRFAYRQLFSLVLFRTVKRALDGRPFSWDKLERSPSMSHTELAPKT